MKKILIVATVVKQHIISFHIPFMKQMSELGFEVHVAARNDYDKKIDCYIPFCDKFYDIPFERSPLRANNLRAFNEISKIIKNNDYDFIHCHTPVGGLIGRLSAKLNANKNCKILYTAHGFHFYKGSPLINWILYYPVEKILSKWTDSLITINEEDYKIACAKFNSQKTIKIPGVGVELNQKSYNEHKMRLLKNELGLKEKTFVLLSVGELNENKNHQVVIRALSKLENKNIHYLICGQGKLESKLLKLSVELNVREQVHFLGFRNDVNDIYKISDVFVFPSFREGLSLSLMEAMACGLPVVCSNIRGNKDLVEEEVGGFLINPMEPSEVANAIERIIFNETLSKEFGMKNTYKIASFSLEKVLQKMKELYAGLES